MTGSPVSTIVEGVKRAMAGEYSRDLSAKVFAGQCRLIEIGFRQGGAASYLLRRFLLDQSGAVEAELKCGEHKSLQTDRVILRPGPPDEVANINKTYQWFVEDGLTEGQIAARLNALGLKTDLEREWSRGVVHHILTNEKYIDNNVFNRTSFKLKIWHVANPPEAWIRKDGAFEGIVPPKLLFMAQVIIRARCRKFSNEEMLEKLKGLFEGKGFLSGILIDETEGMPSTAAYRHRFGSLVRAYQLVGFSRDRDYADLEINRKRGQLHPEVTYKKLVSRLAMRSCNIS